MLLNFLTFRVICLVRLYFTCSLYCGSALSRSEVDPVPLDILQGSRTDSLSTFTVPSVPRALSSLHLGLLF